METRMACAVTLADYMRDPRSHTELVDGRILQSPRVGAAHRGAARRLAHTLEQAGLNADVYPNVVLKPERGDQSALVREPDVYATRAPSDQLLQPAEDMLLVCEIVAPGSGITDWVDKMREYAQAGIPQYWILDFSLYQSLHLYTFDNHGGAYAAPHHWDGLVDIEVAGTRVRFDVRDLSKWSTAA
jgi:Uma2 family endonuclease